MRRLLTTLTAALLTGLCSSSVRRARARLNFGDCFAYALAAERGEPLLYKGDDFGHTDVRSALADD